MLTCASIFTNVALVGFTSDGVSYYIQSDSLYARLWVVVLAEHLLFLIKVILGKVIDDIPESIERTAEISAKRLHAAKRGCRADNEDEDKFYPPMKDRDSESGSEDEEEADEDEDD